MSTITINIDLSKDVEPQVLAVLRLLAGDSSPAPAPAAPKPASAANSTPPKAPAPKPTTAKPAASKPKPEPEPEPEPEIVEDDLLGDEQGSSYTLDDVLSRASELVNSNKQAAVRAALPDGVKRVRDLPEDQYDAFMEKLKNA